MKYLICLLFVFLSFGQLQRISFFDQTVNIYLHELVMVIVIALSYRKINFKKIFTNQPIRFFSLFILALFISLFWNFWQFNLFTNIIGFFYLLRLSLYFLFFICLFQIENFFLKTGFLIFTLLTIIFSAGQYFLYPNLRNLYYLGWDPHQYRVFGTFFDTTVMGIILTIMFFYNLTYLAGKSRVFILATLLGLIFFTYSRITYLSFILGFGYWVIFKKKFRLFLLMTILFIVILPILPRPEGIGVRLERLFSIESRLNDQKTGVQIFLQNPILGVGYNRITAVKTIGFNQFPNHSQSAFASSFITILAASGFVGFLTLGLFLKSLFENGDLLARVVLIVVSFASLFDNVLLNVLVLCISLVIFRLTTISHKSP